MGHKKLNFLDVTIINNNETLDVYPQSHILGGTSISCLSIQ